MAYPLFISTAVLYPQNFVDSAVVVRVRSACCIFEDYKKGFLWPLILYQYSYYQNACRVKIHKAVLPRRSILHLISKIYIIVGQ